MQNAIQRYKFIIIALQVLVVFSCLLKVQDPFSLNETSSELNLVEEVEDKENGQLIFLYTESFSYSAFVFGHLKNSGFKVGSSYLLKKGTYLSEYLLLLILGPPIYN